ncbi:hypothetical protein MMC29_001494 [Sticta canariensis]|nr:hypothetical protein [Sticta canariensis]
MAGSLKQPADRPCTARCRAVSEQAHSIQYEDEYEKSNAAFHLAWNACMAQGSYKSPSFYKKVSCLLFSWDKEVDDLGTEKEVADLTNVFENTFRFKVKRALLTNDPDHLPQVQVTKHIGDFLYDEDGVHTLLLVYYAGHGRPKPMRDGSNCLALTGKNRSYDKPENLNEVVWDNLENNFQHTKADVLEIFDCCYAGDLGMTPQVWGTRSFEFLGACPSGNTTLSPGKGSFTSALIWALEALVKDQTRFTLSELSCKIREAPNFPRGQVPVQFDRCPHTLERIIIAPLLETENDEGSMFESIDDTVPQGLLNLNFFFERPPRQETIKHFAEAMNRLVYEQKLPVTRIVWGGLCSWGGVQPSFAAQNLMMKASLKFLKAGKFRKKSRDTGDKTIQLSESASQKPSSSVSKASPQSNADPPPTHDHKVLERGAILIICARKFLCLGIGMAV